MPGGLAWRMLFSAAADLLLGGACLGCDRPGKWLCASCRNELVPAVCAVTRPGFPERIWAAGEYSGVLRKLLPAYKDANALQLAAPLGQLLAAAIASMARAGGAMLVPLPSAPAAVRLRGDAHMIRLARVASTWLNPAPPVATLLRSARRDEQVGLAAEARATNLHESMRARSGTARVVICDDIVTTGASLVEAHRALSRAGYQVVGAAVIAHTPRRIAVSG